jgi:hypothetical protein
MSMAVPVARLGSALGADDDEGREADQQCPVLVCLLQVLPPLLSPLVRERAVGLEDREVTAEEELSQRVVDKDLHRIEGERLQVLLLEEARELPTDPAVADRVGVGPDNGSRGVLVWVVDDQGVPVEIEDEDPPTWAGDPHHLRERPLGIGLVLQQAPCAAHIERGVREGKRLHLPDLKGDGDMQILDTSSGLSDHDFTGVEPNQTASRTDEVHHVEHIGPGTAAHVEDGLARRKREPFQHEPLARLDRCRLLCLIHEPYEEVRILGAVDLREQVGMGMGTHADPPLNVFLCCCSLCDLLSHILEECPIWNEMALPHFVTIF